MVEGRDGPRGSQGLGTLPCTFQCTWAHATPRAGPVQESSQSHEELPARPTSPPAEVPVLIAFLEVSPSISIPPPRGQGRTIGLGMAVGGIRSERLPSPTKEKGQPDPGGGSPFSNARFSGRHPHPPGSG